MATNSLLHLVVILLVFSQIIALEGVPITRTRNVFDDITQSQGFVASDNTQLKEISEETWGEEFMHGRMDLENNDYSGSGPNDRHTPKPPAGRG